MSRTRHQPIRTCVACRQTDEKRDLLRVVRLASGGVAYDPRGKMSGRGAYVCARVSCIALARRRKGLERSLKIGEIPEAVFEELLRHATPEPGQSRPGSAISGTGSEGTSVPHVPSEGEEA